MTEMPLLSTSLVPPLVASSLVVRQRLLTRLDAAGSHRLTLVAASAGWGKTTLLSMWAVRSSFPVAWLSLSTQVNDPARFWVAVIAALRHSGAFSPLVGERSLTLLRSPQPLKLELTLDLLNQDLRTQETPIFLLLDDYQVIDEQAIHEALLFLLEHLPAHLHLVIASRIDPPLALARLRARGMLLELRDVDLRFQEQEASQFLTRTMALALDPAEVVALTQRTEGWIAGLHLAALALAHSQDHASFIHGFAGSHRYLVDYVQEDILAHLAQPLQDFLLHCAILTRMSAPLCQSVMEHADQQTSQQLLERLERANLFLVPLDEERRWYRLHDLFREALLARLHATRPEVVPLLHLRAASWYEQQDEFSESIAHRLAAADYTGAARVMEETAEQFWLRGEIKVFTRWLMALPDEVIRARAGFVLKAIWYLLNSYAHTSKTQFTPILAQVEFCFLSMGQLRQVHQEGLEGLALLEHIQGHAQLAGYFSFCLARAFYEWNQLHEARTHLLQVIAHATTWQQIDQLIWRYADLVKLEIAAGNFQTAHEILQEESFRRLDEKGLHGYLRTSVQVYLWLAEGNRDAADSWAAQVGVPLAVGFYSYSIVAMRMYQKRV